MTKNTNAQTAIASALAFAPLAGRGIEFATDDEHVYLRLPKGREGGIPSASGKMVLTASTANGWTGIPGTEMSMNLNAGFKVARGA